MNAPLAIPADVIWFEGPCCSNCDGSGLIDTGSDHGGRAAYRTCAACGVEAFGEVESRGMRCPGLPAEPCVDGIHAAHLTDGAYQLESGRLVCRACGERAMGGGA